MSLRSLRVLLVTAAAVGGLGLAGAAFADDGDTVDFDAPPVFSPVQLDMQAIQMPLQDLVGLSEPGAAVTTALVPDDNPTEVLVTVSNADGEHATDAKLDADYLRSLVMAAPMGERREALEDALRITADNRLTMHDLSPAPITVMTSPDTAS